ncbi:MAG: hypothetical protein KBS91_01445, partial [Firmicutes bacterium]|nr:hypothetical protein [Candidatus Caballimonas caccae]
KNNSIINKLLLLFQADYSGCKDDLNVAPLVEKWSEIMEKMKQENIPFSIRELNVNGLDLQRIGIKKAETSKVLDSLLKCVCDLEIKNEKNSLLKKAKCLIV